LLSGEKPVCHEFSGSDGHCLVRHFCLAPAILEQGASDIVSSTTPLWRGRSLQFNPTLFKNPSSVILFLWAGPI